MQCRPGADDRLGPQINGCRNDFDFTLLFEESFFTIAPCALLLISVPARAAYLRRQNVKTLRTHMASAKQAAIALLCATQLALLIVWSVLPAHRTRASIPAASLSFLASLALLVLSSMEHSRSIRPSAIINIYMLSSLLFDVPQVRTLWLRPGPRSLPAVFTVGVAAKTISLFLEARSKRSSLYPAYRLYAPEALVSLYDQAVLWWINPLFERGFRGLISFESLYPVEMSMASDKVDRNFKAIWSRRRAQGKSSLLWALVAQYRYTVAVLMVPRLVNSAFRLSQPLLINRVTGLLAQRTTRDSIDQGRGLIGATALIYIGIALSNAIYKRLIHQFVTQIRATLILSLYRKALRLPSDILADDAVITLTNTDISRITNSLLQIDELFATPVEIAVAIFLLERQIGVSCVAPIAISIVMCGISFATSNVSIPYQKRWLKAISERISYTSAVLGCPKGFKMLGLTEHLIDRIHALRIKELEEYSSFRKFSAWRNIIGSIPDNFSAPVALTMFTLINGSSALTQSKAFTTLSLVALLTGPVVELIHAVPRFQTALASVQRIEVFLLLDGDEFLADNTGECATSATSDTSGGLGGVELSTLQSLLGSKAVHSILQLDGAAVHLGTARQRILHNINFDLKDSSLTILVGPVGSGKSTLLRTIIGEVPLSSGRRKLVVANQAFAYCAQTPWLPNGSVKDLIAGCNQLDEIWLDTIVSACALDLDLKSFPHGLDTIIGTRGLSLSGGQRQRLALARAVYARKSVLVVDDALSGLDGSTAQHVFEKLLGPTGLCKSLGITVILATHSSNVISHGDYIIALAPDGHILEQGTFEEVNRLNGYVHALASRGKDLESNEAAAEAAQSSTLPRAAAAATASDLQHDLARRTGDTAVYGYYARSIGWGYGSFILSTAILSSSSIIFTSVWVSWWSADSTGGGNVSLPLGGWIAIYFAFIVAATAAIGSHIYVFLVYVVARSARKLHEQLLHSVMRAPYAMFVETDTGLLLNRFSNDMTLIELDLVGAVMQTLNYAATCIGASILIVLGSKYAAASMPFLIGIVYILQKVYLRTSRQIRFMDLEALAPLMTHIQETVTGVSTIRAFGWTHEFITTCTTLLDNSQRAFYLMLCIQRWLGLILDLLTAGMAVIVVTLAMELRESSSSGAIGVSLLQVLSFNSYLSYLINAWTMLETSLGAIARIRNFEASTAREAQPKEIAIPPPQWPAEGQLTLTNLSARYSSAGADAIKNLTISIAAGSKVGICGRSGSGKSSLLLTILRLLDTTSGTITLDGVDIAAIPRETVRLNIAALPQEAIILPGSVRTNLDPLNRASDAAIEEALASAGILDAITTAGGLDCTMSDLALSHGQLQLFAVARTLLRPSKLLILDEMTSSVDSVTEERVMEVIREGFKDSTILAVAHRLKTIVEYDQIVVMDAGRIVECGEPKVLLEREGGRFREMWEKGGH